MRLPKRTLVVSVALLTVGFLYRRLRTGSDDTQV